MPVAYRRARRTEPPSRATSRTPTSSRTRRAGPPSTWIPARRWSRCRPRPRSWGVEPEAVLRTHSHADHVEHEGELGLPVKTDAVEVGGLQRRGAGDSGPLGRHGRLRRQRRGGLHRRHALQGLRRRRELRAGAPVGDGRPDEACRRRHASCPGTPTRRRSGGSGRRTRSSESGAGRSRKERSGSASPARTQR